MALVAITGIVLNDLDLEMTLTFATSGLRNKELDEFFLNGNWMF